MTSDFLQKEPTNFILMTQEPTALQSIAPTRHSIHHRISGAILLLPITILLSACNEQWTISKIWVNPQPLAGNETVFPVVLVAPSQQRVVMEVVFDRDTNFTNRIGFKVSYSFYEPVEQHYDSSWLDWVASSRGHAVILDCFCSRSNAGRPLNLVVRGVTGNPPFQGYTEHRSDQQG